MSPFPWRNTVAGPNDINTNKIMSLGLQSYFHPFNLFLFAFTLWLNQLFQTFIILLTSPIQPWPFEILATTFICHIIKKNQGHQVDEISQPVLHHLHSLSSLIPVFFALASDNELFFYSCSRPAFLPLHLTLSPCPFSGILFRRCPFLLVSFLTAMSVFKFLPA